MGVRHQSSVRRSCRWESACQWTCMTAKRNAVLMPNSSTPFTACRALSIWNRDGNVNPGISNVVMLAKAKTDASVNESSAPSHQYADAHNTPSNPCRAANISATAPMWPIMVEIARSRSGLCLSTRTRILVSRPKAINTTAVVWIAMVSTMSERPRLQLERSTRFPYHRSHRQTAITTEVDWGSGGLTADSAASGRLGVHADGYPNSRAPARVVGPDMWRKAMGDFGIAGLWLLLALALVVSVLVAAGSLWLADRTLPKPVPTGHNGALSPF